MKMIPSFVYEFSSRAEEKVFGLLDGMGVEGFAMHSLNLKDHKWKLCSEIDFVCVTRFGILCLEVKGGKISRHDGRWFTNGNSLKESPFQQVRSATYALKKSIQLQSAFGWGVVMPDSSELPIDPGYSFEEQANYLQCKSLRNFERWFRALEEYWGKKHQNKRPLDPAAIQALVKKLRPNFERPVPLGRCIENMERKIEHFTEEQFDRLDAISENERILCQGGAGTGKTFLAMEVARRESKAGKSVLVVARSQPLVNWIGSQINFNGVQVMSAEELIVQDLSPDKFDVLVVDEGQDLLSFKFLSQLDSLLKNGLDNGRWRWFMDDAHQAGFYGDVDGSSLDLIKTRGVALQRLTNNCRNTKDIVKETQLVTGADIGTARLYGGGDKPEFMLLEKKKEIKCLADRLHKWRNNDEINYDRMVVLVCDENYVEQVEQEVGKWVDVKSVGDFKGLEKDFVAIVGISTEQGAFDRLRATLYTALTRARIHLWMAIPEQLEEEWKDIRTKYLLEIMKSTNVIEDSEC